MKLELKEAIVARRQTRQDSVEAVSTQVRRLTSELLGAARESATERLWFPNGIDSISLSVSISKDGASASLALAGPKGSVSAAVGDLLIEPFAPGDLAPGQKVPDRAERDVVGPATTKIVRGSPEFAALVRNANPAIVFKDEEGTGADRMMTSKLSARLDGLAGAVATEWPGTKLRVTEAWDENDEHGTNSIHYEARAADLTTMPLDASKIGRLGRLAANAGCEWVFHEVSHIHVSMSK